MCDFITPTVAAVMSISAAAVSAYATNQTAKAQKAAIRQQQEHEREELHEKTEEELGQRIRQTREARARARVAAGESGALGASFAAMMNQSLQDQDMDTALMNKNLAFAQRGLDDRAATSLASVRTVSGLEAGLSIAGAGMRGYSMGKNLQDLEKDE